jgi:hypothetical protein
VPCFMPSNVAKVLAFPILSGSHNPGPLRSCLKLLDCLRPLHVSNSAPHPPNPLHCRCRDRIQQTGGATRLAGHVITLSFYGCYIELPKTLPIGREVSIKIFAGSEWFAATAKIVYELPDWAWDLPSMKYQ